MERLREATKRIAVGKISGAVGTYSNISPEIEIIACKKLGLEPALISTQIIQRDRYAEYVFILALIATTIEKIALEIRNLQRTETREVEEPFGKGQKGSSAMPHKRNPVKCEQLCGLARVARAYINVAMENQALWHERDISHSSTERIMLPDVSICVDYMLYSITQILSGLIIYPDNIEKNLKLLSGLTYSSGLLTELIRNGLSRKQAYSLVQELAMVGWDKKNFYEEVANDAIVKKYISPELLKKIFSHDYYVRHREYILDRVFKDKIRDE
jgi:adenylosuccinate lyase